MQPRKHEDTKGPRRRKEILCYEFRAHSPKSWKTLVHRTIGCCIAVHRELGPGLLEGIYRRAICLELNAAGILFECEKAIPVTYRGEFLCEQRLDFVVGSALILEVKSVEHL
jgi:GxxExxY protein